jgi:hypothetical protein
MQVSACFVKENSVDWWTSEMDMFWLYELSIDGTVCLLWVHIDSWKVWLHSDRGHMCTQSAARTHAPTRASTPARPPARTHAHTHTHTHTHTQKHTHGVGWELGIFPHIALIRLGRGREGACLGARWHATSG